MQTANMANRTSYNAWSIDADDTLEECKVDKKFAGKIFNPLFQIYCEEKNNPRSE